jgi:phage terminase small subunit
MLLSLDGENTMKMTGLLKLFCEEYVATETLDAGKAAIAAGYKVKSKDNAQKIGSKNLKKPAVQSYIAELMAERSKRTQITADMVLQEIAKVAFINLADFVDEEGQMLPPGRIKREHMAAVQEFTERVAGGNDLPIVERRYKLNDKMNALEKLGKHLKLFTDKVETEITTKGSLADLLAKVADD